LTVLDSFDWQGRAPAIGVFVGLATTLVTTVVLAPASRVLTRLTGYAGVVLTAGCLLVMSPASSSSYFHDDADSLRYGMWLFYLVTALAIATYIYRDVQTRRMAAR
jgi:hypothetical protein